MSMASRQDEATAFLRHCKPLFTLWVQTRDDTAPWMSGEWTFFGLSTSFFARKERNEGQNER